MFYFFPEPGTYTMASNSLGHIIGHLRNLGGDRTKWCVMVKSNQGMVNVPVLDSWF